jgi:hypothetical protein
MSESNKTQKINHYHEDKTQIPNLNNLTSSQKYKQINNIN